MKTNDPNQEDIMCPTCGSVDWEIYEQYYCESCYMEAADYECYNCGFILSHIGLD